MNKNIKKLLSNMRERFPENVVNRMYFPSENTLRKIESRDRLETEELDEVLNALEEHIAFFLYVLPLIEPIAYCRLDDVKLVGLDTFDELQKLEYSTLRMLEHLRWWYIQQIDCALSDDDRNRARVGLIEFEKIYETIKSDFEKHVSRYRHPYQ
jgi:hypothetical protein